VNGAVDLDAAKRAVLMWGLPVGEAGDRSPPIEVAAHQLEELIDWCHAERFEGLLRGASESGHLVVDEVGSSLITDAELGALRRTLTCEGVAAELVALLTEHGIRSWLLKGLATAHLDYPDPSWRGSMDVDLLVPRSDLLRASAVLTGAGFVRVGQQLPDWWEERFGRALVHHSPEGVEIDLHAALAPGYFGLRLPMPVLLDRHAPFDLGGVEVAGLDGPGRLLHSCYALVLSRGTSLRLVRDLAQQLVVSQIDWEQGVELARSGDGEAVMARALDDMAGLVPLMAQHPSQSLATTQTVSGRARRALRHAARGETVGWSADARSALLALGAADRVRFSYGVLMAKYGP